MPDLSAFHRINTLWLDTFRVFDNNGLNPVTTLTNTNFTKTLLEDGVISPLTVEVAHLSSGIYQVAFLPVSVGNYDLALDFTVSSVQRHLLFERIQVRTFGLEDLIKAEYGDKERQPGNPTALIYKDYDGSQITRYNVTDTSRTRTS